MAKKRLRISSVWANDVHVADLVSRIFASFDRIPAPLACGVMIVIGGLESFQLFRDDVASSAAWYVRAAPFIAFGGMVLVALFLVASSRSAVVYREMGTWGQRSLLYSQYFGRLITVHAVAATIVVAPALIVMGKFSDAPKQSPETIADKTIAPATPPQPPPAASVAPAPIPSASAAPSATVTKPITSASARPVKSAALPAEKMGLPPPRSSSNNTDIARPIDDKSIE